MLTVLTNSMKKLFSIFLIFSFFYLMPVGVFAQEDVSVSVQNADESADIDVKILNVVSLKGEVTMELEIANNTDEFIDTLNYNAELYQGDELQDFGYRFGSVEYVYTGKGSFDTLNPRETKTVSTTFSVPENLEEDTYFLRLSLSTKDSNRSAIAYTESPFFILGDGGYLGAFSAFIDVEGEKLTPDTGLPSPQSVQQYFEIPFEFNQKLESYLSTGNTLKAQVTVSSVSRQDEINSQTLWYDLKDFIKGDSIFIPIVPENELVSGPYSAEIKYSNSTDEEIATNSFARIYIEGLTARISSIDTSINEYKKGQLLDLVVPVAFGGHSEPEVVSIESEFRFLDGEVQKFTKHFSIESDDQEAFVESIDFSSEVMPTSGLVQKISVTVRNSEGQRIAIQDLDLNTNVSFGQETSFLFYLQLILILVVVILILLGIKRFFPNLMDSHKNTALQLLLLVASSSIIVLTLLITLPVSAQPSNNDGYSGIHTDTFMDIWTKLPDEDLLKSEGVISDINTTADNFLLPSGLQESCSTGRDLYTDIYVRLRCAHCLNGVSGEVKLISGEGSNPSLSYDSPEDYKVFIHSGGGHSIPLTVAEGDYTLTNPYGIYTFPEGGNKISPQKAISGFQGQAGVYGPFTLPVGLNEDVSGYNHGDTFTKTYRVWGKTYGGLHCTLPKERMTEHALTCKVDLDICDDIVGVQTELPLVGDTVRLESDPNTDIVVGNITGPVINGNSSTCPLTVAEKPVISCGGDKTGKVNNPVSITASGTGKDITFEWTNYSPNESEFTGKTISGNTLTFTPIDTKTYSVDITATDKYGQKSNTVSCPVDVGVGDDTPDVTASCVPDGVKLYPGDEFTISTQATSDISSAVIELNVTPVGFSLDTATQADQSQKGVSPLNTTFTHSIDTAGSYSVNYEANYEGSSKKATGSCQIVIEPPLEASCIIKASSLKEKNGPIDENGRTSISVSGERGGDGEIMEKVFVDWAVNVSGGEGPYTYDWRDLSDGAINSSPRSTEPGFGNGYRTTYDNNSPFVNGANYELREGKKISIVKVTDSVGNVDQVSCAVSVDIKPDICKNIVGIQETMPNHYSMDPDNLFFCELDKCDNLPGVQTEVPDGYERRGPDANDNYSCVLKPPAIEVSCNALNEKPEVNKPITFVANVINGEAPFDFGWGNATELQRDVAGRNSSATATYTEPGIHEAFVTVYSNEGEHVGYAECKVNISEIDTPDFEPYCIYPGEAEVGELVKLEANITYNPIFKEYFENTPMTYSWIGSDINSPINIRSFNSEGIQTVTVAVSDGVTSRTANCPVDVKRPESDLCLNIKGIQTEPFKEGDTYVFEGESFVRTVSSLLMTKVEKNCYPVLDFSTNVSCIASPSELTGNGNVLLTPKVSGGAPSIVPKTLNDYDFKWTPLNYYENSIVELNNNEKQVEFFINSASVGGSIEYVSLEVTDKDTGDKVGNSALCSVNIIERDICNNIDGVQSDPDDLPKNPPQSYYYEFGVKKQTPKNGFDINEDGTCTPRADSCDPNTDPYNCEIFSVCSVSPAKVSGIGGRVLMTPYLFNWDGNYDDIEIRWFPTDQERNLISPIGNKLNQAYFHVYDENLKNGGERYAGYGVYNKVTGKTVQSSCLVGVDPILDIECRHDKEGQKVSVGEPVNYTLTAKLGTGTYKYRWIDSGRAGFDVLSASTPTSFQTSFTSGGDHIVTGEVEFTNTAYYTQLAQFTCPNVEIESTPDLCQNIDGAQWPNIPGPGDAYLVNGVKNIVPPNGLVKNSNNICTPTPLSLSCVATPNSGTIGDGIIFNADLSNDIDDSGYTYSYNWAGHILEGSGTQVSKIINQGDIDYPQTVKVSVYESIAPYRSVGATCPFTIVQTPPDLCPNIDGNQETIPGPGDEYYIEGEKYVSTNGLELDIYGQCIEIGTNDDFTNECRGPRFARPNYSLKFTSNASPADESYVYKWSGVDVPSIYTRYSFLFETLTMSFNAPGIYDIVSTAKKGDKEVSSICKVDVRGYPELDGACTSNPAEFVCVKGDSVEEVDWIGTAVGGTGEYKYRWSGAAGGTSSSVSAKYTKESIGTQTAQFFIDDGAQDEIQRSCSIEVLDGDTDPRCNPNPEPDPLVVDCKASKSEVKVGERVDWILTKNSGGLAPYEFGWSFIDSSKKVAGFSTSDGSGAYSTFGIEDIGKTKTVRVNKKDSLGNSESSVCSVKVIPGDYKPIEVSCGATPPPVCVGETGFVDVKWFGSAIYGNYPYKYRWTGEVTGTGSSVIKRYTIDDLGPHTAFFSATDGLSTGRDICSIEILDADHDIRCNPEKDDIEVSCKALQSPIQAGKRVDWIIDDVSGGTEPYTYSWSGVIPFSWSVIDGSGAWSNYPTSEGGKTKYAKVTVLDKNNEIAEDVCAVVLTDGPTEYSLTCEPFELDYTNNPSNPQWKKIVGNKMNVESGKEIKIGWSATPTGTLPSSFTRKWTLDGILSSSPDNQWQTITAHTLVPNETRVIPADFLLTDNNNGDFKKTQCSLTLVASTNDNDRCPNIDGDQYPDIPQAGEKYKIDGIEYTVPSSGMTIDDDGNCVPVVPFTVSCSPLIRNNGGAWGSIPDNALSVDVGEKVEIKWQSTQGGLFSNVSISTRWTTNSSYAPVLNQRDLFTSDILSSNGTKNIVSTVYMTDGITGDYATDTCSLKITASDGGGCNSSEEICDGGSNPIVARCNIDTRPELVNFGPDGIPYFRADESGVAQVSLSGSASPSGSYNYTWHEGDPDGALGSATVTGKDIVNRNFRVGRHDLFLRAFNGVTGKSDNSTNCSFFVAGYACDVNKDPLCDDGPGGDSGSGEIKEI